MPSSRRIPERLEVRGRAAQGAAVGELQALMPLVESPFVLVAAVAAVLLGATVQGTMGFGLGVVAAPLLGLAVPDRMPQLLLLISLPLLAVMLARELQGLDRSALPWLLSGRLAGVAPGVALVGWLAAAGLQVLFGVLTLVGLVLIVQRSVRLPRTPMGLAGTGAASGLMATAAGLGGPPLVLLYADDAPATLRSTIAAVFLVGNAASVLSFILVGRLGWDDLVLAAICLPALGTGFLVSTRLIGRLGGAVLRHSVLGLVAAAAVLLIWQGAVGG